MSKKKKEFRRLENKVLALFKKLPTKVMNFKQIASQLDIKDTQGRNNIIRALNQLQSQKKLISPKRGSFIFNKPKVELFETQLNILPTGKGSVLIETNEEALIVPKKHLNKGLHQDIVLVSIHRTDKRSVAHVEQIVERSEREHVGIFERHKDFGFVLCRKGNMYTDLFIERAELGDFKEGDKVVAVFKEWEEGRDAPNGKIVKSLGAPGRSETEIHSILHEYGLPYDFPTNIETAAEQLSKKIEPTEIKKRRDFRDILTFTIDPISAKDFDDALSFKKLENGCLEVGVHIEDVSHYVQPNSLLDQEAYDRATSVYLVDRVVPMLPEVLSNGLCSLRPNEEKYTFSAVFVLNEKADVIEEWYGKTVILSDQRFSYEEVQYIIENQTHNVDNETSLNGSSYEIP